jgi:uncharacterized membrane protein YeaQ/YmgE (transglycosylase-associated protein family)
MILTLILGGLAGWAARPAEPKITEIILGFVGEENLLEGPDRRVMSLVVCLMLAGVLLWIGTDHGSPFLFALAAGAGYFQAEIREAILNRKA